MKAVLRGKFIALRAYIKKLERSHSSKLTAQLKALEQKEANKPNRSRGQEVIKLRAEINKIERREQDKESVKQRIDSLRKPIK